MLAGALSTAYTQSSAVHAPGSGTNTNAQFVPILSNSNTGGETENGGMMVDINSTDAQQHILNYSSDQNLLDKRSGNIRTTKLLQHKRLQM